ncbi:MAG: lipid A biosynthesis acyltransferase [Hyphomicrobiaceae bacterium]|nr:lipid A biosynthesis acyltransferase [Hyphomicrobiaceae bacterium]
MVQSPMVVSVDAADGGPSLKDRIEHAGLRLALAVARRLSIEQLASAGAMLMRTVGPRLRQHKRALANLAIAFPDKSDAERQAIACAMWANMGRTYAETLVLDRIVAEPSRIAFPDRQAWTERAADGMPIVGCTLHLGNWEVATLPLAAVGRRATGVYKPLDNPLIDAWLVATRTALYPGGLLGKADRDAGAQGHRTARQLIDRARSGGALGFVCDHFDRRGDPIPFMGRTARFATIPAMIARHVGARLWLGRALRLGESSRFRIELVELDLPRTGDKRADGIAATTAIFAVFERWIREHPEQWMWWNTRWVDSKAPATSLPTQAAG